MVERGELVVDQGRPETRKKRLKKTGAVAGVLVMGLTTIAPVTAPLKQSRETLVAAAPEPHRATESLVECSDQSIVKLTKDEYGETNRLIVHMSLDPSVPNPSKADIVSFGVKVEPKLAVDGPGMIPVDSSTEGNFDFFDYMSVRNGDTYTLQGYVDYIKEDGEGGRAYCDDVDSFTYVESVQFNNVGN